MKESRQERLVTARRHQILDSAAKVFSEKGFHPATIKDIAREAGIADGTIYNYFENKPALLLGIFERMQESVQANADFTQLEAMDLHGVLTTYLRYALMALKEDNFALFRIVMSEIMVNAELRERYFERILNPMLAGSEQLLEQWALCHAVELGNGKVATRLIASIVLGLMISRVMGDATLAAQWDELPAQIATMLINGIGKGQS